MARLSSMSGARLLGVGLAGLGTALSWPLGRWHGPRMKAEMAARAAPLYRLRTPAGSLTFRCGSAEAVKAAARFVYDEPETVWWVDHLVRPGDCVWDVGANVGLYALYAALRVGAGGAVIAFEPAADNYAALCRNVTLNPMPASVQCYCAALANDTCAATLHLTSQDAGRAAHVFGRQEDAASREVRPHTQSALGFSADDFLERFGVRAPDHVKIDVDSIEELILRGGRRAFAGARSIIVELNTGDGTEARKTALRAAVEALGFVEQDAIAARFADRRNRIFVRP